MNRAIPHIIEELLGEYWDIAFKEATDCIPTGNAANKVLHRLREEIRAYGNYAQQERKPARSQSATKCGCCQPFCLSCYPVRSVTPQPKNKDDLP